MRRYLHCSTTILALVLGLHAVADLPFADAAPTSDEEAQYIRTITERADRIVAPLASEDAAKASRVRDLIVNQYRSLREIHAARDAKIAQASKSPGDAVVAEAWRGVASLNPVVHLISGFRWAFFGLEGDNVMLSLGVTFIFLLVLLGVVGWIFRTGYRLKN